MNVDYFSELEEKDAVYYVHHILTKTIETEMHLHSSAQLIYAEGGIIHVFTDNKHWYLPARCFMWIPANVPHYILSFSPKIDLYNIYFKSEKNEDIFYNTTNIYSVGHLLREMILFTKNWNGKITLNNGLKYNFLKALKGVLAEGDDRKLGFPIQHPFPKDELLLKISNYINDNLEKSLTIEDTAKKFGMSTRTLSRKFNEHLGVNYVRFVRALRITKSLELMAEEKYNMYEIALSVGYNSLSSFSTIFKKVTGIAPTEYNQRLKRV